MSRQFRFRFWPLTIQKRGSSKDLFPKNSLHGSAEPVASQSCLSKTPACFARSSKGTRRISDATAGQGRDRGAVVRSHRFMRTSHLTRTGALTDSQARCLSSRKQPHCETTAAEHQHSVARIHPDDQPNSARRMTIQNTNKIGGPEAATTRTSNRKRVCRSRFRARPYE